MKSRILFPTLTLLAVVGLFAGQAEAKTTTADFVKNAAIGNKFEIESSKLALDKSSNDGVKSFAQTMIDDHGKAADDMKAALDNSKTDSSLADQPLDAKHQRLLDKLKAADAADFDRQYVSDQLDAHKDAVTLFSAYSKHGKDASLKHFASNTLPTLKSHLAHVKKLHAEI